MEHTTSTTSTTRLHNILRAGTVKVRRAAAVLLLAAGLTGATVGMAGSPAGASIVDRQVDCTTNYGAFGRNLSMGLPSLQAGTTVAIYLYKWVWNGYAWTRQYQNAYDAARASNIGGWIGAHSSGNFGMLQVTANGSGAYFVAVHIWAPNGAYVGGYWSNNQCYF